MNNDTPSGDDLPIIDVRSPAERATDAGRAGFGRLQERLRESHFDIAAFLWMLFILGLLAVEIYGALRTSRFLSLTDSSGWTKATLLAQSGNALITFGSIIGVALAAWSESGLARAALIIAAVIGVWVVVANVIGIAVIFHSNSLVSFTLTNLSESRAVSVIGQVMLCGLGAVVVFVAGMLLSSGSNEVPDLS